MKIKLLFVVTLLVVYLSGCASSQSLTKEEREIQNRADAVVSGVLFENELDEAASYNVHKNGFVVIKFAKSVPVDKYTNVVVVLRSNPDIHGVSAEQAGVEVCPLNLR